MASDGKAQCQMAENWGNPILGNFHMCSLGCLNMSQVSDRENKNGGAKQNTRLPDCQTARLQDTQTETHDDFQEVKGQR